VALATLQIESAGDRPEEKAKALEKCLLALHSLHGIVLEKAVGVLDLDKSREPIVVLRAKQSGRYVFLVAASKSDEAHYLCTSHHCSCLAFAKTVAVNDRIEHLFCKHQLASRIAYARGTFVAIQLEETEFNACILRERVRPASDWRRSLGRA